MLGGQLVGNCALIKDKQASHKSRKRVILNRVEQILKRYVNQVLKPLKFSIKNAGAENPSTFSSGAMQSDWRSSSTKQVSSSDQFHYDDDDDDDDDDGNDDGADNNDDGNDDDDDDDDDNDGFQVGACFERSRAGRVGGVFSHPAVSLKCLGGQETTSRILPSQTDVAPWDEMDLRVAFVLLFYFHFYFHFPFLFR